jgi:hypothetical protein
MIGPNIPDLESNKTGYKMGDRVYIDRTPMRGKIVGIIRDKNGRLSLLQLQLKGWPKFIKRTLRDISKYPEYDKKLYKGRWNLNPINEWPENAEILGKNIRQVFSLNSIEFLSRDTYMFLVGFMGFGNHGGFEGFKKDFANLSDFAHILLTGENSNDLDHNNKEALRLVDESTERNGEASGFMSCIALCIRTIVAVAFAYHYLLQKPHPWPKSEDNPRKKKDNGPPLTLEWEGKHGIVLGDAWDRHPDFLRDKYGRIMVTKLSKPEKKPNPAEDYGIGDIAGAMADPLVVFPGAEQYGDPQKLQRYKEDLILARLGQGAENIGSKDPKATEYEAFIYLDTWKDVQLPPEQLVKIYEYLARRYMEAKIHPSNLWLSYLAGGYKPPKEEDSYTGAADFAPSELTPQQKELYDELRRSIYQTKIHARAARMRGEKMKSETVADVMRAEKRVEQRLKEGRAATVPSSGHAKDTQSHHDQVRKVWLPTGTEPWMLTKKEFIDLLATRYHVERGTPSANAELYDWERQHRKSVAAALLAHKPVSATVLGDYPGIEKHPESMVNPKSTAKIIEEYLKDGQFRQCDFCAEEGKKQTAWYNGLTTKGTWADMCMRHARAYAKGTPNQYNYRIKSDWS